MNTQIRQDTPEEAERNLAYAQLFRTVDDLHTLLAERERAFSQLKRAYHETLNRLALAAEYKDEDTGAHLTRIGEISALLGQLCGADDATCEQLRYAAPMHDVGKIGVPDSVLKKRGRLDVEEWAQMREHPMIGARILGGSEVPILQLASVVAATHHERFDGGGYPAGLAGEAIPLVGRIVALADYFDALTMDRCYRPRFPDDEVFAMIQRETGRHFDPVVAAHFLAHWQEFIATRDRVNEHWARSHPAH